MKPFLLGSFALSVFLSGGAWAREIKSIQSKNTRSDTVLEILGVGLTAFKKEEKKSPPQLVLTFDNATLGEEVKQKLDSSILGDSLLQVSSYPLAGGKARIVIDFAKAPKYTIETTDHLVSIHVKKTSNRAVADTSESISYQQSAAEVPVTDSNNADTNVLGTIMNAETNQKFTGSPITLKLKNADVHEVLRMISEASGFNIVIHPSVTGNLTLSLDQVPWDQALDVVLTTLKLGAERNDSVLRVMPRDLLVKEKQDDLDAKRLSTQAAPRITRVFPISYQDLSQIQSLLTSYTNSQNSSPGASGTQATILVDANTQSLIVRDTTENVERIRKMIALLDVQTPQVLIEGKVIEATENFTKDLEGSITFSGPRNVYALGINTAPANASGVSGSAATGATGGGGGGATRSNTISLNIVNSVSLLANLNYSEKMSKVKIVSSPKTVVLSGKQANISQTTSIAVQNSVIANGGGTQTNLTQISAKTSLDVTPRVTNDGSVFMKLSLSRDAFNFDDPARPSVAPRTMQTEVIVDSGNTLVIGGILNLDEGSSEQGFPILRKIPIIGWLFGSETSQRSKTEVMFFVTPRILNQKRTAIGLQDEPPKAAVL